MTSAAADSLVRGHDLIQNTSGGFSTLTDAVLCHLRLATAWPQLTPMLQALAHLPRLQMTAGAGVSTPDAHTPPQQTRLPCCNEPETIRPTL